MTFNSSAESPANTVLQSGLPFFVGRFQAHHIIPVATFGKTQTADSIGSFLLAMESTPKTRPPTGCGCLSMIRTPCCWAVPSTAGITVTGA
ncbi:MAG TPA: hypothetical protein VN627_07440 [Novosphingobium sp.]|jgi:hypothetical protein|nr:hypothetical protein [Novosphingobium sp.]